MWYKIGSDNTAKVANFDKHPAISILKVCRMNDKKAQRGDDCISHPLVVDSVDYRLLSECRRLKAQSGLFL